MLDCHCFHGCILSHEPQDQWPYWWPRHRDWSWKRPELSTEAALLLSGTEQGYGQGSRAAPGPSECHLSSNSSGKGKFRAPNAALAGKQKRKELFPSLLRLFLVSERQFLRAHMSNDVSGTGVSRLKKKSPALKHLRNWQRLQEPVPGPNEVGGSAAMGFKGTLICL